MKRSTPITGTEAALLIYDALIDDISSETDHDSSADSNHVADLYAMS